MSGLIAWWPFHEQSGQASDLSGNDNHGSVSGPSQGVVGRNGLTAYSFDGSNDMVNIPNGVISSNTDFTFSYWIRNGSSGPSRIFRFDNNIMYIHGVGDSDNDGDGYFDAWVNSTWHESSHTVPVDEWVHITATYDSSTNEHVFYENGNQFWSFSDATSGGGDGNAIGADDAGSTYYDGSLCDFRIYNRILTQKEINKLYEWGTVDLASPPTDGISRYTLDGDATDSWGSNDGTNSGVSFVDDAVRGQSGEFDGSSDIDIGDSTNLGPSKFTIQIWVKPNMSSFSDNTANVLSYDDTVSGTGWKLGVANDGSIAYAIGDGSRQNFSTGSGVVADQSWSQIVLVFDESNLVAYCNGVRVDSQSLSTTLQYGSIGGYIGRYPASSSNFFAGEADDVRIYDYALSPHEVYELYRFGSMGRDMRAMTVRA